jgi:hypothetical protein
MNNSCSKEGTLSFDKKKKIEEKEYCVKEEEEEKQRAKETLEDHCEKKLLNMGNEHI